MSQSQGCLAGLFGIRDHDKPVKVDEPEDGNEFPFRVRDDFLSNAELSFYHVLRLAIDAEWVICPKVSLAELFFVTNRDQYQKYLNMISRKRIDFLICDSQTMRPLYAIELDDKSHQKPDRVQRDSFVDELFIQAGIDLIRFPVRSNYVLSEVKQYLQMANHDFVANQAIKPLPMPGGAPLCPKCGVPMLKRVARNGNYAGREFYGCPNYPRCKETNIIPESTP